MGYVFGYGMVGCFVLYALINLMSPSGIMFDRSLSALGYSMLPIVALAAIGVVLNLQ